MAEKWSRADRINLVVASIAILSVLITYGLRFWNYIHRPQVQITSPHDGASARDNTIGAKGTAGNIPPSDDLWFVVRSGIEGRWYPVTNLVLKNGHWSVGRRLICPASGAQDFEVFLVSDTSQAQLHQYLRKSQHLRTPPGLDSMPAGAVLKAVSHITVPRSGRQGC